MGHLHDSYQFPQNLEKKGKKLRKNIDKHQIPWTSKDSKIFCDPNVASLEFISVGN